jgi:hypothetical protein
MTNGSTPAAWYQDPTLAQQQPAPGTQVQAPVPGTVGVPAEEDAPAPEAPAPESDDGG